MNWNAKQFLAAVAEVEHWHAELCNISLLMPGLQQAL
jgi:hypothetical protein